MLKKIWRFIWRAFLAFIILSVLSVIIFRFVPIPFTILMIQRCVEQKLDSKEIRCHKKWLSFGELPNNLQLAVVASEDQNFLFHHGFDFHAIQKAVEYNEKQHKTKHPRQYGASSLM